MIEQFFCNSGIQEYTFGPNHPLKSERLRRTLLLLESLTGTRPLQSDLAKDGDLLRCHSGEFVDAVRRASALAPESKVPPELVPFGFGSSDNPPFKQMDFASRSYVGSTVSAARAVREGSYRAFSIGGGLHHAMRSRASGFCIFNDVAIACSILRERFARVAYVDIDVHHGDGVQSIFFDDPTVLTCSIHEEGRTLFPGTGSVCEVGAERSAINVPLRAKTPGDIWLRSFREGILSHLFRFRPEAIVLQLGTDTHFRDPLGHLQVRQQDWLAAIRDVHELAVPVVAAGGGGYDLTTVPRMWVSAILTLSEIQFPDTIPEELREELGCETFSDKVPLNVGSRFGEPLSESDRDLCDKHAVAVIQELNHLLEA